MPKDTTSPFTPGRPVPVELFVGRAEEIERLRRKVRDAVAAPRVEVAFVTGERGIGKSSLASFVRFLGERDHQVLGVHALLGGITTVEDAVKRVFDRLLKEHTANGLLDSMKEMFGKHVRKVGLFGMTWEFDPPERELRHLANNFSAALRNVLDKAEGKKGIVLILDDINGLADSDTFANWFKSLVDEISTSREPLPLCVFLVGLDERRRSLIARQPSLARVFDPVDIRVWSSEESRSFFEQTFKKVEISCEPGALDRMTHYTGGLPVLAHEIGDAVFSTDNDGLIDRKDAGMGVFAAADIVGRRYLDPLVYDSIRSTRYREILRQITRIYANEQFTRADVRASLADKEKRVFDNFLEKMKDLGVIVQDSEGSRGAYQFSNRLHYLYFFMQAEKPDRED